ncbi:Caffeic acid O-methyltransferase [Melia azedarach]|uniref:Caffeic acid O-methyltransferase n=1 Tax=Melia azedarach TaxID=155640 RepID=A0ACC1WPS5_MELAZ|nr:Caffeic acid O-methyltransferase [Melia azedarach]
MQLSAGDAFPQGQQDHDEVGKLAIRLANAAVLPMALKSSIELSLIDIVSAARVNLLSSHLMILYPSFPQTTRMPQFCWTGCYGSWQAMTYSNALSEQQRTEKLRDSTLLDPFAMVVWLSNKAHGVDLFEYSRRGDRFRRVFNQAMSSYTSLLMSKVHDVYDGFKDVKVLVDVGGGCGATLSFITSKYSPIEGINYDLPHVIADAPSYPGGDMFIGVPKADAVYLKRILHDWSDARCFKILKNC